jgi:leucyl-tRNA synthetase
LTAAQADFRRLVHMTLKQAQHDYARVQYNTVVSASMKMLNAIDTDDARANAPALFEAISILLRTLYPIAPHVTHALWAELGFAEKHGDLLDAPWPSVDESALKQDEIEVVVQVNGKLRSRVRTPAGADEATARAIALADEAVQKFIGDKPVRKTILVPGKLINLVV